MTHEQIVPALSGCNRGGFSDPWWQGYNDALNGTQRANIYRTRTARVEYDTGYDTACGDLATADEIDAQRAEIDAREADDAAEDRYLDNLDTMGGMR